MKIEEAVTAVTAEANALLSCLGQPVVAYHVTAIMSEADFEHAREMQLALMRRSIEALVDDGLEDVAAEHFAARFHGCVGSTWRLLHRSEAASH
ncbi:hypothetical protein LGH82_30485 [Mesorhizobium sp. PAMC28654]|uniref:hypothetical protein n=1 Tax=Mesorhizobium sp. PAMC28654 TaxID=2880934 RepID=UPI001D0A8CD7|nr:hypothetical protein [Mesorhizobium sp. PAMC28654]UDL89343.1 hypothetical protein LGH82_30485 [Mesorhizobium sp. PAMC28654]